MRGELDALRATAVEAARIEALPETEKMGLTWDELTHAEKSAASLGVSPDAWQPIAFLNEAHHEQLKKKNLLDPNLARRIDAYKHVSQK